MEKIYVNGNEIQSLDVPCRSILLHSVPVESSVVTLMNALNIVTNATMTNYTMFAITRKVVPCINIKSRYEEYMHILRYEYTDACTFR